MADLSPLDILGTTFSTRLKGYDPGEVQSLLSQVATTVEGLLRDRGELRQQVHRLEHELAAFRKRERALQEALVAAQRSAEETLETARRDGQQIVEEGQVLADQVVEDGLKRARRIETVIASLRTRRREVRSELMRLAELLQGLIHDDQQHELEEPSTPQLALLKRRRTAAGDGPAL